MAPYDAVAKGDMQIHPRNRVSWGAIFAGLAIILVTQLLLSILGVGIGASSFDVANPSDNPSASGFSMSAGIWWTVSGIVASLLGGLVAGRLSGAALPGTARWHGLTAWAASTLIVFWLMTSARGGVLGGAFSALGSTLGAAGRGAASAVTGISQRSAGDALQNEAKRLVNPSDAQSPQQDIVTYIRASVSGDQATANAARDRAVNGLAQTANISPDEARNWLQQAAQQAQQVAQQAKQKAEQAAEATRKATATAGLYGFVALLLGAIAAWIGGGLGAARPAE